MKGLAGDLERTVAVPMRSTLGNILSELSWSLSGTNPFGVEQADQHGTTAQLLVGTYGSASLNVGYSFQGPHIAPLDRCH